MINEQEPIETMLKRAPMAGQRALRVRLAAAALLLFAACGACAEGANDQTVPGGPTVASIQALLQSVQTSGEYDEATRQELTAIYNGALEQLRTADGWAATAAKYAEVIEKAPGEVTRLRDALQQPPAELAPDVPTGASVALVEGLLARAESELAALRAKRAALEEEIFQRGDRRRLLPELLAGARRRLSEPVAATAAAGSPAEEAGRVLADARYKAVQNEISAYEKEIQSYELRGQLLTLELDQAIRDTAVRERQLQAWREAARSSRQADAVEMVDRARQALAETEGASPRTRQIAEGLANETVALVMKRTAPEGVAARVDKAALELAQIRQRHASLSANFSNISQKVGAAGLNNSIGLLLRRYRENLPDLVQYRQHLRARQDEIAGTQMEQVDLQERRLGLADIDGLLDGYLYAERQAAETARLDRVEQTLRDLLQIQRDTLDGLVRDYETYFEHLVDLDSAERALIDETKRFTAYIDERVLWIRSGVPLGASHLGIAWAALEQISSWEQWAQLPRALWLEFVKTPQAGALLAAFILVSIWLRRRMASEMTVIGERAASSTCTSFRITLDAVAVTVLLSAPALLVVWWVGQRLASGAHAEAFARAIGSGLKGAAWVLIPLEFARQSMRRDGLFRAHLNWPVAPVSQIRRHLAWLMAVNGVVLFMLALLAWKGEEHGRESLGRVAFMVNLGAVAAFLHIMLHPRRGAVTRIHDALTGAQSRFRHAWYILGVGTPLVFVILAFGGYFYTAYRLTARLYETALLLFVLVLLRGIVLRWSFVAKWRLAMEQARAKREALNSTDPAEARAEAAPPHEVDIAKVNAQTYRLVQSVVALAFLVGAWFIWTEELPALRLLNQVPVWPESEVTLAHIVTGVVIIVLTLIATANIPGLLELTVLQRMRYLKGDRYAITTIVRYAIAIVGFGVAFHNFGVGWSRIQWLVAALGVGLGFGLQEIFANFISGIIILFERPIRVGDIVTVGGISGTVSRIRTRATWIVDFDRKELIVPNREFITTQVVNWTLTDSVLRVTIPVGIAYGSNTELAERLLYDIARENPDVLEDPAPLVLFSGFGESALAFELRVFCGGADSMLPVRHALHMAIERTFREAGIEIAFPQRDVHIRSINDVPSALQKDDKPAN